MKKSIFWLKAMACILITNSHMGGLYPQSLRALSFGGYLGNCLFFGIAGYLLAYCRKDSVAVFLKKRVLRIYIPYLLVVPFVINAGSYLGLFELVFPIQNFHFLPTIITLYPVFYLALLLADKIEKKGLPIILVGVYALQLVYYVTLYQFQYPLFTHYRLLPMLSYFQIMLIGALIRRGSAVAAFSKKACTAAVILTFGIYAVMSKFGYPKWCGIFLMYDGQIFTCFLMTLILSLEERLPEIKIVTLLGKMTLEIYLVQYIIIDAFKTIVFPTGMLFAWISIAACAYCLNHISEKVQKSIEIVAKKRPERSKI